MKWFKRAFNWVRRNVFKDTHPSKPTERHIETDVTVDTPIDNTTTDRRVTNKAGFDLITHFEGYYSTAYKCPGNVWTIGWGTIMYPNGVKVKRGDTCNKEQAEKWLRYELAEKEVTITKYLKKHGIMLNSNQFSALVSFCYNLGTGPLTQSNRSLSKAVRSGSNPGKVVRAMKLYNKAAGKKLRGLVRRREAEAELFLS